MFHEKLLQKLPLLVGEYAVEAGLKVTEAPLFVKTYLRAPTEIMTVPGVNLKILDGALLGSQWAYAYSLHYVW